jgi:hypothetical protein
MAAKAHKLRLETLDDGILATMAHGFLENMHESHRDAAGREQKSVKETRRIDRKRLLQHVKVKVERSMKGRTALMFMVFTGFYMTAVVLQRNCRDAQSVVSGMRKYLTQATFRDPTNFELKTVNDLATIEDVWMWHYYVLAPKLYVSKHYNGAATEGKDRQAILTFNRLTTGFRMVQRRALNATGLFCVPRPQYQSFVQNCYGRTFIDSRFGDVSKAPFYSFDRTGKYVYREEKSKGAADANVGFFEHFGIDQAEPLETARAKLMQLQRDMWLNQGTAWMRTDFVTYNPNVGLFCFVKFTFEFVTTGELRASFQAQTMKGGLYQTAGDMTVFLCEVISIVFWVIFQLRMFRHFLITYRSTKSIAAFFDFDHTLEFMQNFIFVGVVIMRYMIWTYPIRSTLRVTEDDLTVSAIACTDVQGCGGTWWEAPTGAETISGRQIFFDSLGFLEDQYFNLNAANFVFCLIRILSYLRINPNISQVTDTFLKCRKNLIQFALVLFVMVSVFDLMAIFMFGAKLQQFSNLYVGFVTTGLYMLGSGSVYTLFEADQIAAALWYYPFLFVMVFVVLNMTIAIIIDGYMYAHEERLTMTKRREDLSSQWLASQHPTRKGWKESIHSKSVYSQLGQGTIRFVGIVFAWALPAYFRNKKLVTGEVCFLWLQKRFASIHRGCLSSPFLPNCRTLAYRLMCRL